jgi:membrane-bound metal-dependent hydrolase YbcI (DUF457 family)
MASPVAHSFAGLWFFLAASAKYKHQLVARFYPYLQLGVFILLANLADADFFFEVGFGVDEVHRGASHSLAIAAIVAVGLSWLWQMVPGYWRSALLYFSAYCSHLAIDMCTGGRLGWTNSGSGIPLLWPWQREFSSPLILFYGIRHGSLSTLLGTQNAMSGIYELVICGGITALVLVLRVQYAQNS